MRRRECLVHGAVAAVAWGTGWSPGQAGAAESPMAAKPPRLISLSGGMTEVIWRLGAERHVVATDTTSTFPPAALRTVKVGYLRQLSAEGVLALQPTAILGTHEAGPPRVLAQLRQAGIPLLLVQADHSFDELVAKVRLAAQASGMVAQGQALEAVLTTQWQQALAQVAQAKAERERRGVRPTRALFVMCHGARPQSAGAGTAAHAMMTLAGATNALAVDQGYKALSAEAVALARPDVIVTTTESVQASGGLDGFWQHPGLAHTRAAKASRLLVHDAMALLGFGPRLPQAVLDLHQAMA